MWNINLIYVVADTGGGGGAGITAPPPMIYEREVF